MKKNIKHFKKNLGSLVIMLLTLSVFSQHDCGNSHILSQVRAPSCTELSQHYTDKYRYKEHYIPDNITDVIKTVHININLWRKHDGTGGLDSTQLIRDRFLQIVNWANAKYNNISSPSHPVPYPVQNLSDSKIRIVLDSIYYYNDPNTDNSFYNFTSSADKQLLDDYIAQNYPERTRALNWHFVNKAAGQWYAGFSQEGSILTFYRTNPDMDTSDIHDYWMGGHLAHELGHSFDLWHTYGDRIWEQGCEDEVDFLSDVYDSTATGNCHVLPPANNNLMGGSQDNNHTSALQMGIMHRASVFKNFHNIKSNINYNIRDHISGYSSIPYEVSSDETWDFSMKFYQDILVKSGNTLTIKCEIQFVPQAGIVVEKGARLIIDGGKLTNENYYRSQWKGIEVKGDRNLKQNTVNQGLVRLRNGAIIENAHRAITTGPDYAETGGIVKANDSHFLNNKRDVEFLSYHSHPSINNPTYESNNQSYFTNCTFEINDDYIDSNNPFPNVTLWDVNGVVFNAGNVFIDNRSVFTKRDGILSIDASYYVNSVNFTNLNYGIKAYENDAFYGSINGKHIQVQNSNFNSLRGVYFNGLDKSKVVNNTFVTDNSGHVGMNTPTPYGIYLDRCLNYQVEDNNFSSNAITNGGYTVGILVSNYSEHINTVKRNDFDGHTIAVEAIGQNKNEVWQLGGLEFRCNDFNNSMLNIFSSDDAYYNHPVQGIAPNQGSPGDPAYNLFGNSSPVLYKNLLAQNDGYNYFAKSNGAPRNIPTSYSNNITVNLEQTSKTQAQACAASTDPIVSFTALVSARLVALNNLNQATALYNILIDGGETEQLKTEVLTTTNSNAYNKYIDLMNKAGELSEEVLIEVAKQEDGFTVAMVRNILVANPVAAKIKEIEEVLDNRILQLPDYMRAQIRAGKTTYSTKEFLAFDILNKKKELAVAIQRLVEWISEDTELNNTAQELLDAYSNTNLFEYELNKLKIYTALNNENEVYNQKAILLGFKNTEAQNKYVNELISLYELRKEWNSNNIDIASLSSKELEQMNGYLSNNNRASSNAIAILALNNELNYEEPIYYPNMSKSLEIPELKEMKEEEEYMIVYPNPAVNFSSVRYAYLEPYVNLTLSIIDINGKVVYTLMLTHSEDEIILPITKFSKGNYVVNIEADGKVVYSDKLIKI